ncbi:MAG: FAD-binding protein [Acidobacteria bacterium]|nr:MAG: FAD-binding protein [Acidobacteriota bacterium]
MTNWIKELQSIVGDENVLISPDELLVYECDALTIHKRAPRAVIFPTTTEHVSRSVKVLGEQGIPFVARGAGTGLSGGALAEAGGVIIELSRMNRILEIDWENQRAIVQPGVINIALTQAVATRGYHFAPDPSSQPTCTIGGNVAENASGPHCLKYGVTTDHILGLEVVLPDGRIINLDRHGAVALGYDLVGLFVGSEGMFGIATRITVRLTRLPRAVKTLMADFPTVEAASQTVSDTIAAGVIPAAMEMMDQATVRAVEESVFASGLPIDAAAVLIIELDGLPVSVDYESSRVVHFCRANGARHVIVARSEAERERLWAGRKNAFGALGRINSDLMVQDAVIPRSRLPEVLPEIYRIAERYRLRMACVIHAGDGNLHPTLCFDGRDADELRRVDAACKEIMELCVRVGGTLTGEHGIGLDKVKYMSLIFSEADIEAMARVRAVFDPRGLCNPGKVLPVHRCKAF